MVAIKDNRAVITGTLKSISADADLPDHQVMELELEQASPVAGFPQLVTERQGERVRVVVPGSLSAQEAGAKYRLLVRAVPGKYFYAGSSPVERIDN
jgi:hypothetical protein